ncbi:MAG: dihydroorotate dehydrogenase electron transfer subunit [Thermodesulfobacteriota bacterium]
MIDRETEVAFNTQVAADTYLMGLKAPEIAAAASPGQFVMIRVGSALEPLLRRPLSIGGILQGEQLLILYKVVGRGTALMAQAGKGDHLSVMGPLGRGFAQPRPGKRPILVAGGIGIAPLLFMAQTLAASNLLFLAGYRSAAEMVPFDRFGLATENLLIATDDGSAGQRGFVTGLLDAHIKQAKKDSSIVYACGPAPMLKKVAALTIETQTPCQMSLEANMACALGACQGCAVKASVPDRLTYYLVCKDGPVFPARAIDWGTL